MCSVRIFKASMPFGLVSHVHFRSPMRYHRLYQVSVVWIVLPHVHMDWIAVRRLRPYAHLLGRAQPPRTSAPRGGAVQALQPRQLHRDHLVGAAMVANVCLIFAVCVWISIFAASCPLLVVLLPLSTVMFVPHAREAWVTYRAPFWDSPVALSNPFSGFPLSVSLPQSHPGSLFQ